MPNSPCKNCEKRHVGCHGKCADYISFKKEVKDYKKAEDKKSRFPYGSAYKEINEYRFTRPGRYGYYKGR